MRKSHLAAVGVAGLAATAAVLAAGGPSLPTTSTPQDDRLIAPIEKGQTMADNPYAGMWITDDGRVRHELLPNGRYDEARGTRESAYQGRYEVTGNHIDYWDDTGFSADGTFVSPTELHHGGMILRRQD